ncbi:hypothetical protein D3C87_2041670 [compost metagenome]
MPGPQMLRMGRFADAVFTDLLHFGGGNWRRMVAPTAAYKGREFGNLLVVQPPAKVRHGQPGRGTNGYGGTGTIDNNADQ